MLEKIKGFKFKSFISQKFTALGAFIAKWPIASFAIVLFAFVALIITGNLLRTPKTSTETTKIAAKKVHTATLGSAPTLQVQAQIEKSGVVTIQALSNGVVQKIYKTEGDHARRGDWILNLSTNYQGGNVQATSRALAQKQLDTTSKNYDLQVDLINKQKDAASKGNLQASDVRDLTRKTIDETQSVINLNEEIIKLIDAQTPNPPTTTELSIKQMKLGALNGLNQAKNALRQAQYNGADDKPPADIANLQKDIAIKQLEIQQNVLDLGKESAKLQLQLAQIQEGLMYPAAPFAGTIQRILVKEGQNVTPGTPLAIIAQDLDDDPAIAVAYVAPEVARNLNKLNTAKLTLNGKTIYVEPSYITTDAVKNGLHAVYLPIPDAFLSSINDKEYVTVELKVGSSTDGQTKPFIPVDAVYQTTTQSTVYVVENGIAKAKVVSVGIVNGAYVQVEEGLIGNEQIIIDRNVIAGDKVEIAE